MWRSWVDRINTINKGPEDNQTASENYLKREQQKAQLHEIWKGCTDLLSSDEDREEALLLQFIPLIQESYEQYGNGAFTMIPDERSLIQALIKQLIKGIRKVPDLQNKAESNQELMDSLRSPKELYNVLKGIEILSFGPESALTLLLQNKIPSITIKLFRSFISLPQSYYEKTVEEGTASVENVRKALVNILKQFVNNKNTIHRLLADDIFVLMIRVLTVNPTKSDRNSRITYVEWKAQMVDVLKSSHINSEVCQYLKQQSCIEILVKSWEGKSAKSKLTVLDHQEIMEVLDVLYYLFYESTKIHFYGLMDEMVQSSGYNILFNLVKMKSSSESLQLKLETIGKLVDFIFVGKEKPTHSVPTNLSHQHTDISRPQSPNNTDKIVKNIPAFNCLFKIFEHFSLNISEPLKEINESFQFYIFSQMKEIIMYSFNYFILESTDVVPRLIENMDSYSNQIQKGVMDILIFIVVDLDFVPFKELAVISFHFQSSSSGKTIPLICQYLTDLLSKSHKYLTVIQEAGLLNIMSLMLSDVAEKLQLTPVEDEFVNHVLASFDSIIDCIVAMTTTPTNVTIFQRFYKGNLADLLQYSQTRVGALRLLENLLAHSIEEDTGNKRNSGVSNDFGKTINAIQLVPPKDVEFRLEILEAINRILKVHKFTQNLFKISEGYIHLVSLISSLEGGFKNPELFTSLQDPIQIKLKIISVIQCAFSILSLSMQDNTVNKKYFLKNVGYRSLEKAIILTDAFSTDKIPAYIFGILFAFAIGDESIYNLFVEHPLDGSSKTTDMFDLMESTLKSATLVQPEIVLSILRLQDMTSKTDVRLSRAVLCGIYALAQDSRGNRIKMNSSGLVLELLNRIFPILSKPEDDNHLERDIILEIISKVISMGVSSDELKYIFQRFNVSDSNGSLETSPGLLDLVLQAATRSRWPNFVQFQTKPGHASSLKIPQVVNFPPANPGYTLLSWIHIEKQDINAPALAFFSVWEVKTLTFRIYIESKTKTLRVYNQLTKQESIFKTFNFQEGSWYHVAIVHYKSRLSIKSSTMTLYVNGSCIESITCAYINPPLPTTSLSVVFGAQLDEAVQSRSVIWNLGPTYLMQDTIEKEIIAVLFNLGPRYKCLFQDQLRQFQTYEASAALRLSSKTDSDHAFSRTSLIQLTKYPQTIPQSKIILAFFGSNALNEGFRTGLTMSGISKSAMHLATKQLASSRLLLNSAVPKLDTAIKISLNNMGRLIGDPLVAYPLGLDESLWKIGGCSVAFKLIERSSTPETLRKSIAILLEIVRYSWRNSEEMEKLRGYEILAYMLRQKRELITTALLDLLLVFIGKSPFDLENSVINNPLAYNFVILNFDVWKKTSLDVQRAHLEQFVLFLNRSKKRSFNSRRLAKVHLVKKILIAFRMNIYSKELTQNQNDALKAILMTNWTADSIRSIATFLASTIANEPSFLVAGKTSFSASNSSCRSSSNLFDQDRFDNEVDVITDVKSYTTTNKTIQMRIAVFQVLKEVLCDDPFERFIKKFSEAIKSRWLLLFFGNSVDPVSVVSAAQIFAKMCITQGAAYIQKFKSDEGFIILKKVLPAHWNITELYEVLILMMFGIEARNEQPCSQFSTRYIRSSLKNQKSGFKLQVPELIPILISMWDEGKKVIDTTHIKAVDIPMVIEPNSLGTIEKRPRSNVNRLISHELYQKISSMLVDFFQFFNDMYNDMPTFKDACNKTEVVDSITPLLFSSVCLSYRITADEELQSKDSLLANFDSEDPNSPMSDMSFSFEDSLFNDKLNRGIDDDLISFESVTTLGSSNSAIKRGGASTLTTKTSPHVARRGNTTIARLKSASWIQNIMTPVNTDILQEPMVNALVNFIVDICTKSILDPQVKNLSGLSLVFLAFPPSTHEQQLIFESYLLTYISQSLKGSFQLETEILMDSRVLGNIAKYSQMAADAVIQGRFKDGGVEQTYDLLATLLEILHTDEFSKIYQTNDSTINNIYRSFNRMILLKISDLERKDVNNEKTIVFLDHCIHHQKIILSGKNTDMEFLKCFCYHLYRYLVSSDSRVKDAAANIWKLLVLQKPERVEIVIMNKTKVTESEDLVSGFKQIIEMDIGSFYRWLDSRKVELNTLFNEFVCKSWENMVLQEIKNSKDMFKNHVTKRVNRLKKIRKRDIYEADFFEKYDIRSYTWLQNIHDVEVSRFAKMLQDIDGQKNFIQSEWSVLSMDLIRERAIWGQEQKQPVKWRLDYTEGPNRMRKRLQIMSKNDDSILKKNSENKLDNDMTVKSLTKDNTAYKDSIIQSDKDLLEDQSSFDDRDWKDMNSDVESSVPSTNNSSDNENENDDDEQQVPYEEDKNRKVLRLLDQGDSVMDVYNVSQIAGLDAREGLLLLCKNNIYLIDNFFQLKDGEVVNIRDVPKEERDQYLLMVSQSDTASSNASETDEDLHTSRKWAYSDLRDVFKRRFLFRNVAIEIFFNDGQNALITVNISERENLYSKLISRVPVHRESGGNIFGRDDEKYIPGSLSSTFRLSSIFGTSSLNGLTQRWERREISNFQYLMYLNAIAGRSYNDLTQYPVFPWILADYKSKELDLNNPKTFRDLTRPMGAQTEERRHEFAERYKQWGETDDPTPAFHYGTHYSSAMIVCSLLIRLEPFTQHYLKLQGGTFDHADRLFDSIESAWESASEKNMGDVRELIPEFFYLPEFLTNENKFDFGVKQGTGEAIDSVLLPPWAHGDPKIFIQRHREALESDYVSANLHHWIDLIFGYKQQGQAAVDSLNVFHYVSYEGAVDLDAMTNIVEKTATIGMINNFGQTPSQLFKKPHPSRIPPVKDCLSSGYYVFQDHLEKLVQSANPIIDIKREIEGITLYNDKLGITSRQRLLLPPNGSKYVEWGFTDNSLRVYATDTGKILKVFENTHLGYISTLIAPDSRTFITGGTDNLVCTWDFRSDKNMQLSLTGCLRGHDSVITTIAASKTYSVIVSGSTDGTAIIWDLNRKQYVRSLVDHEAAVSIIQINESTGDIITCAGHTIRIWTINGDLYLKKSICPNTEPILSCIFYQQKGSEWSDKYLIITGHKNGIVKFWFKELEKDRDSDKLKWGLVLAHQLCHQKPSDRSLDYSDIIALAMSNSSKTLLTGNRQGQLYSFVMPDTTDTYHLQMEDECKDCRNCKKTFSVFERQNHCRACGGLFCSGCISSLQLTCPDKSARFCRNCYELLAPVCNRY